MKFLLVMRIFLVALLSFSPALAFSETELVINAPAEAVIGESISITLDSKLGNVKCALRTNYNGSKEEETKTRIGYDGVKFPFTYIKIFSEAGEFLIVSEGKSIGLTPACNLKAAESKILVKKKEDPAEGNADGLKDKANRGDVEAMIILGKIAQKKGEEQEAANWYKLASAKGDTRGHYMLALMYQEGSGLPQNFEMAHDFLRKAILKKHPEALFERGKLFFKGLGIEKDLKQAYIHFNLAAVFSNDMDLKKRAKTMRDDAAKDLNLNQLKEAQAASLNFFGGNEN